MMNVATSAESFPAVQDDHEVSSVAFQTLVFSVAIGEVALGEQRS